MCQKQVFLPRSVNATSGLPLEEDVEDLGVVQHIIDAWAIATAVHAKHRTTDLQRPASAAVIEALHNFLTQDRSRH